MAAETKRRGAACTFRRFTREDANAVREIFRQSPEAGALTRDDYECLPEGAGALALVSERAGQVTGFFIGREAANEAEVLNLAVKPKYRRQGDGGALVLAALEEMRSRGVQSVFLEVRESNLGAIAFYESFGFSKIGRRKVYYRDPEEAAITMEKKLTGPAG